jgi:hypothetical protein
MMSLPKWTFMVNSDVGKAQAQGEDTYPQMMILSVGL